MRLLESLVVIALLSEISEALQYKGNKETEQSWDEDKKYERARVLKSDGIRRNYHGKRKEKVAKGDDENDENEIYYGYRKKAKKRGSKKQSKKSGKKHDDDDICFPTVSVANRMDGTLSILDAFSGELWDTIKVPKSSRVMSETEPRSVETSNGVIYVADYNNNRIVAIDGSSYELLASIPTGSGPTLMSIDALGNYLWVTCVTDNTVIVIDLKQHVPIRSIEAFDPEGEHEFGDNVVFDVLLEASGSTGYVTYRDDGGLIVKYDSSGSIENFRAEEAFDMSRLATSFRFNCLYVSSMPANSLSALYNGDLGTENVVEITEPGAAVSSPSGGYIYIASPTTNLIYIWDVAALQLLDTTVTTSIAGPTEMTHTGDRLFVTHPEFNKVSVFEATDIDPIPIELAVTEVGDTPDGIAYLAPSQICDELFYDELNYGDNYVEYYYR